MACNCKVDQKISYIQRKYGPKGPQQKTTHMAMEWWELLQTLCVFLITVILSPILLFFVIGRVIFSKSPTIKLENLLFLRKYGKRKEQIIQD